MRRIAAVLILLLGSTGCSDNGRADLEALSNALDRSLSSGSATAEGEVVYDALEGRDDELWMIEGEVDFGAVRQSLTVQYVNVQPGEQVESSHIISSGPHYYLDQEEVLTGYPRGTEWVRISYDEPLETGTFPDQSALLEPLVAMNLLHGAESVETVKTVDRGQRFTVDVDFAKAAKTAPPELETRLAMFQEMPFGEDNRKGVTQVEVLVGDDGEIEEIETAIAYFSGDEELAAHQRYTVRFMVFGQPVAIETPPEDVTSDWDPDLYIEGLSPPKLQSEEYEITASTCESDLIVTGSLEAMAQEWQVQNPPEDQNALIRAIASKYVDRYFGATLTGEPFEAPPALVELTTEACSDGIKRALKRRGS